VIVGAALVTGTVTAIENIGSAAVAAPSLTLIAMLPKTAATPVGGVPARRPVLASNVAQGGRPEIAKANGLLSTSLAVGVNAYGLPAWTDAGGTPEMIGAELLLGAVTTMLNGASDAALRPSLTEITMLL
jgi:hypothetical protein